MIETILHHVFASGGVDLFFMGFGFFTGLLTMFLPQFRLPILLTRYMIEVIHWWLKTHPKGKELSANSDLDDKFYSLFGEHLDKVDSK